MNTLLDTRRAGVLLHPTSLPNDSYSGTFGAEALRFIDLLAEAGFQVWQVLPLGPTHADGCPYQSLSVHAGNPDLIDLHWLVRRGWLSAEQAGEGGRSRAARRRALDLAARAYFKETDNGDGDARFGEFLATSHYWLEDYVRFQAFRDARHYQPWTTWPDDLREHQHSACESEAARLADRLALLRFRQFVFHCQWCELRRYANDRGVLLFGDMPIYVHLESADVWAHQALFDLDPLGRARTVTGVPPDYFCADGQLWGNPQYNWARMAETGFDWWLERFASAAAQFDIVRIDHFRALQAYWEIPATATSAREGRWVRAPGRALLQRVQANFSQLCLVAENLGTIGPEVEALREEFALPGMVILQFGFDGNPDNPHLSHMHAERDIVYTGTHDNDTTLGWFESLDAGTRERVYQYFGNPPEAMPWMLVCQAMASRANTAIIPWQDCLQLDARHRMNTPGTREGNWQWRFGWDQVPPDFVPRMRELLEAEGRVPPAAARQSLPHTGSSPG